MKDAMTQGQRLDALVEAFLADAALPEQPAVPADPAGRRQLLRALMNVRPPRPLSEEVLRLQDAYLRERAAERGVVTPDEIPSIARSLGSARPFADRLSLWQGDITRLAADAIVNAANAAMLGCFRPCHDCIDNCIHTYAGVQLRADCDRRMQALRLRYGRGYEQPTAVPMLTEGYNLPARKVVHIVGPIVEDRLTPRHERELADCYRRTLELCAEEGLRSVAFCGISTGVFRFPKERAAQIAVQTVTDWLAQNEGRMDRVIFTVFSDGSRRIYERLLR